MVMVMVMGTVIFIKKKEEGNFLRKRRYHKYIYKVVRHWSDRKKIVHEPLFTSYVFVRVSESDITSLKQTHGIINVVYWLGKPAVIRDSEIETIKTFLSEHINIKLEKTPINVNDRIKVLRGPLKELEGQVLTIKNKTVKVALPSLGYMMFAELGIGNIKVMQHIMPGEINMNYPLYAAQ